MLASLTHEKLDGGAVLKQHGMGPVEQLHKIAVEHRHGALCKAARGAQLPALDLRVQCDVVEALQFGAQPRRAAQLALHNANGLRPQLLPEVLRQQLARGLVAGDEAAG